MHVSYSFGKYEGLVLNLQKAVDAEGPAPLHLPGVDRQKVFTVIAPNAARFAANIQLRCLGIIVTDSRLAREGVMPCS
jgi:hypothetical protein